MNLSNSKEETFSFGYEINKAVRCYGNIKYKLSINYSNEFGLFPDIGGQYLFRYHGVSEAITAIIKERIDLGRDLLVAR